MSDDEQFCSRCFAGVESDEHHTKCVITRWADDGWSAPATAPTWAEHRGPKRAWAPMGFVFVRSTPLREGWVREGWIDTHRGDYVERWVDPVGEWPAGWIDADQPEAS
ncbi:MAG: hypothetical protein K0S70_230 [Microbacterium sp.]|jgi:hypothetical protein|nr:hypothetical protein [Microbacterium sp.]